MAARVTGLLAELDLDLRALDDGSATGRMKVGDGVVDGGLLSIVADVVGGTVAIRAAGPCGISTTGITVLSIPDGPVAGDLHATGTLVHRTTANATVDVTFTSPDDPSVQGVAIAGFRIWEVDGSLDHTDDEPRPSSDRSLAGAAAASLDRPLWERAGITIDDATRSARIVLTEHVANHIGALLGGAIATLAEAAASTVLRGDDRLRSIATTFFAQAREGPVVATATAATPSVIAVEVVDAGADRRVAHAVFHHGPS